MSIKKFPFPFAHSLIFISLLGLMFSSCNKEFIHPEADSINDLINNLTYNPDDLLEVQAISGPSKRTDKGISTTKPVTKGWVHECNKQNYTLQNNFDDVAILRPTGGIIYPGALVVVNDNMLNGAPDPLSIERAPMTMNLDLPGMRKKGQIKVEDPQKSSNVQTALDEALEWWNAKAYKDGYVNAANSSYQASTSYSSEQLSMDVGLNYRWATGDIAAQFNYASSSEEMVAMMVYKQVFYTVTMDQPSSPSGFFREDVSVSDLQSVISNQGPPAYVHSVSYGRIIMFRMRTTVQATDIELAAAMDYARGFDKGSGSVEARSKHILSNSTMTAITIGGNAEVASEAVTATGFGDLQGIITGKNAVYSRDNPGVPIAYSIRYVKDNSFAKMGYTTDYSIEECKDYEFQHEKITYTHAHSGEGRFRIKYRKGTSSFYYYGPYREDIGKNESAEIIPPRGAYDVEIEVDYKPWGLFQKYENVYKKTLNLLYSKKCYRGTYSSSKDNLVVGTVTCP